MSIYRPIRPSAHSTKSRQAAPSLGGVRSSYNRNMKARSDHASVAVCLILSSLDSGISSFWSLTALSCRPAYRARRSRHCSIPATTPASLDIASQREGRKPDAVDLTGHEVSQRITSSLGRSPPARSIMPLTMRPTGVEASLPAVGPAVGMSAMANCSAISDAYGSRCQYRTAIWWKGVPACAAEAMSLTTLRTSSRVSDVMSSLDSCRGGVGSSSGSGRRVPGGTMLPSTTSLASLSLVRPTTVEQDHAVLRASTSRRSPGVRSLMRYVITGPRSASAAASPFATVSAAASERASRS